MAGVLFIFLWLIVSQLATKLSYRRRLDKVNKIMNMMGTLGRTMARANMRIIAGTLMRTLVWSASFNNQAFTSSQAL